MEKNSLSELLSVTWADLNQMAEQKYTLETRTVELSKKLAEAESVVAKLEDDKNKIYESYDQQIGAGRCVSWRGVACGIMCTSTAPSKHENSSALTHCLFLSLSPAFPPSQMLHTIRRQVR